MPFSLISKIFNSYEKICLKNCNFLHLTNNCSRKQQKKTWKISPVAVILAFQSHSLPNNKLTTVSDKRGDIKKKIQPETFFPARLWLLLCHCPLNIVAAVDIKRNNDETQKKETSKRSRLSRFDNFLINYKDFCACWEIFCNLTFFRSAEW